ncbi:MAG TPA: hypothetical protein VFF95_09535 [Candidatus Binatus sp.]|jgi:hypothetical protein|nr:hypothetical protein [Candidatus Binatus sp.]
MPNTWSRRNLLKAGALALPAGTLGAAMRSESKLTHPEKDTSMPTADMPTEALPNLDSVSDLFPTQPPELVREMVTVAHFDLNRVKELVNARPSLARASWDWGFGDWEDALGAASHMGNRPIADYLISKGARPSLFSAAMLGQLEVVKAFLAAQPGAQRIRGPHSISLLAHAKAGGEPARPVFDFLESLGDAGADTPVPLPADAEALKGTYIFGHAANQQIDVTVDSAQLVWTRKGSMGRPLSHLGNRLFSPWGAPAVRIQFTQEADSSVSVMTIHDPAVVLVAKRKTAAK